MAEVKEKKAKVLFKTDGDDDQVTRVALIRSNSIQMLNYSSLLHMNK